MAAVIAATSAGPGWCSNTRVKRSGGEAKCRPATSEPRHERDQSTYCSGVTTKSSGSFTPVEWSGQYAPGPCVLSETAARAHSE
jgi:hypothetical protein